MYFSFCLIANQITESYAGSSSILNVKLHALQNFEVAWLCDTAAALQLLLSHGLSAAETNEKGEIHQLLTTNDMDRASFYF